MRRLFGKLKDLSFDKGSVTMHWADAATSTVPLIWLRDNPQSGQRTSLPTSLKLQTITLDERKDTLIIKWTDRPADAYSGSWLYQTLAAAPVSPPIDKEPFTTESLAMVRLGEKHGLREVIERLEKHGVVIAGHREVQEVVDRADERVVSAGAGLRTEGAYLKEVPKVVVVRAEVSTPVQVLDSRLLSSLPSLVPLLSLFPQYPASFRYSDPPFLHLSSHTLLSSSLVYNEHYRDSAVADKQFYALLGQLQQALTQLPPVQLTLAPGETMLLDNHRVLANWQADARVLSAFSPSLYWALVNGLKESKGNI